MGCAMLSSSVVKGTFTLLLCLGIIDAQPTEAETVVWNQVNSVLEEAQSILAELQSYQGAGQEIRQMTIIFFYICFFQMTNPAIQNDFSYYRRTVSRNRLNNFQNKSLPIEDTTDCLSTMACVCRVMLENP
ncbi:hypothetical protein AB205_0023460 [Aquarana catesbeiana]|uniref:CYRIA/CYRIB Rac1 binding domain-containing protein n=1 Tax=Aquarana catesbeiana TaxID=8400 RepID=A0A2G9SB32_AQUCT|nr:hypothetical protein AB205_0023460 [Aquarana catesbeiana]